MAVVTVHSDFGAQKSKVCHCFPIYLPLSDGTDAMILAINKYKWVQKTIQTMTAAMKLKDACSLEEKL